MRSLLLALAASSLALLPNVQRAESKTPPGPKVGEPAPSFRLNDHSGVGVAVGGKSDRWTVLAFYPKAATPG